MADEVGIPDLESKDSKELRNCFCCNGDFYLFIEPVSPSLLSLTNDLLCYSGTAIVDKTLTY